MTTPEPSYPTPPDAFVVHYMLLVFFAATCLGCLIEGCYSVTKFVKKYRAKRAKARVVPLTLEAGDYFENSELNTGAS